MKGPRVYRSVDPVDVPSRFWLCWFVGFFDGEGSITCLACSTVKSGRKVVFRVTASQADPAVLAEIQRYLGGRVFPCKGGRMWQWCLDGALLIDTRIEPIFSTYPLKTRKAREWELVRPLVAERAAEIRPGSRHTTRNYRDGFFDRVADVQRRLSAGRKTWEHLHRAREPVTPKPRGGRPGPYAKRRTVSGSSTGSKTGSTAVT